MTRKHLGKTLIAAALAGAMTMATSALAAPTNEQAESYYIVQDGVTNRCTVVATKPTPDGMPALAYESRASANAALAKASAYETPDCSGDASTLGALSAPRN